MQRRKFIRQTALVAGGLMVAGKLSASTLILNNEKKLKGTVLSKGKGLQGIVVSDGYNVVITDANGCYEFEPHPDAVTVFVSTPSGYEFIHEKYIARHYHLLSDINFKKDVNFNLTPLTKDDNEHQFFIWADPQVKNEKDIERMMFESVPDTQKTIAAVSAGILLHGITVGDIVWDEHQYYPDYDKAVKKMGIPFFQCIGNHDLDYTNNGSNENSDATFQQTYGPSYYSFNRGQVHYVVLNNVRYLGNERIYDGFVQQNQLDWLKKDLAFVPKDKLIILCLHIPVHKGTKNNEDLYALLEDRNVHIMSGHTHYHVNAIHKNIYEHNHGTVCGAWWTGDICEDGTPNGYGVYEVKGTELSWHYKSTGQPSTYQMKTYVKKEDDDNKLLQVNIWNYDPAWKIEYFVDGISKGSLEQFEGMDPVSVETLLGPSLPAKRGFAEPHITNHIFKAIIPSTAREVKIIATDRFGKQYEAIQKV